MKILDPIAALRTDAPADASPTPGDVGPPLLGEPMRRVLWPLLLLLGGMLWLNVGDGYWGRNAQLLAGSVAAVVAAVPVVNRSLMRAIDSTRRWRGHRFLVFAGVTILAGAYFVLEAFLQHRQLGPVLDDESSLLMQVAMLAHGRLWMPAHPLADFFDTFYVTARPVYASIYFPGTALIYVPGYWLGLPTWVMPVVRTALTVGFTYLVVAELLDEPAGLLAALILSATSGTRFASLLLISHAAVMLGGIVVVWAYLRWRRNPTAAWAIGVGLSIGWAATIRPLDALAYTLPVVAAMAWRARSLDARRIIGSVLVACVGLLPFAAIQLVDNKGITGRWFTSPYSAYVEQYLPGFSVSFHRTDGSDLTPDRLAAGTPQKKLALYQQFANWVKEEEPKAIWPDFWRNRVPRVVSATLVNPLLLIFVPLGLLAWNRDRWIPLAVIVLFLLSYQLYPLFLKHYPLPILPLTAAAIALGVRTPRRGNEGSSAWTTWATAVTVVLCVAALPRFDRLASDEWYRADDVRQVEQAIDAQPKEPMIVLFESHATPAKMYSEFVYNFTTPWPDDARVIRAHDLGPRNGELFAYHAARQPDRVVYHYDVIRGTIDRLGKVSDLARKGRAER